MPRLPSPPRRSSVPYTALVGRILRLCQDYLHHPGEQDRGGERERGSG